MKPPYKLRKIVIMMSVQLLAQLCLSGSYAQSAMGLEAVKGSYAVADSPTPVFNARNFPSIFGGKDGKTLHLTRKEQVKELEFEALRGTVFHIKDVMRDGAFIVYKVSTDEYGKKELYIDSRFVTVTESRPPERIKILPPREEIIRELESAEGSPYVWGSNMKGGIPEMLALYPPLVPIDQGLEDKWTLKGIDCTGLLYQATNGYVPRNTEALANYGESVEIKGLTKNRIMERLEPLDLITWQGHLIIILDKERVIESRLDYDKKAPGFQGGVRIRKTKEFLNELMAYKIPANDFKDNTAAGKKRFIIRRWYGKT